MIENNKYSYLFIHVWMCSVSQRQGALCHFIEIYQKIIVSTVLHIQQNTQDRHKNIPEFDKRNYKKITRNFRRSVKYHSLDSSLFLWKN